MSPVHGTPASGMNAPILRLSLLVLGFSLFFASAARADTWSAGAILRLTISRNGATRPRQVTCWQGSTARSMSSGGDLFVYRDREPGIFCRIHFWVPLGRISAGEWDSWSAEYRPGKSDDDFGWNLRRPSGGIEAQHGFSAAGLLPGTSGLHFGDLVLTGMTGTDSGLNGLTVSQFLTLTNTALGGGDTGFTFPDLDIELAQLNNAFDDGTVASSFSKTISSLPARLCRCRSRPRYCSRRWASWLPPFFSKTRVSESSESQLY